MGDGVVESARDPKAPTPVQAGPPILGWPAASQLIRQGGALVVRALGADRLPADAVFEATIHAIIGPGTVAEVLEREAAEKTPARKVEHRAPLATIRGTWGQWTAASSDEASDRGLRWTSHEDAVWPLRSANDPVKRRPERGPGFVRLGVVGPAGGPAVTPRLAPPPPGPPGSPPREHLRLDPRRPLVRMPALRHQVLVPLTVEVHQVHAPATKGGKEARTLVQRADAVGPAYFAYLHWPADLTLERDLLLLRGRVETYADDGRHVVQRDRFGRPASFALPMALWEEVTPDAQASIDDEETFTRGADGVERVAARRMLPITELATGRYKVRAAPPLDERVKVDAVTTISRRREALELLDAQGAPLVPPRYLEPAHRARNLSGHRITWEMPTTERNLMRGDGSRAPADARRGDVEPPFVGAPVEATSRRLIGYDDLLRRAQGLPPLAEGEEPDDALHGDATEDWGVGRPRGPDALALSNVDRFYFITWLLHLSTSLALDLEVRGSPTLESVALGLIGLTIGISGAGSVRQLGASPWCPNPPRPDGGDLHIRELMRQGFHMLDGPTRRAMNKGTRRMNHWCAAFGPHLQFQLGREPWGGSLGHDPTGAPGAFTTATRNNTGRIQLWAQACGRVGTAATLPAWTAIAGNVFIMDAAHSNHFVTLLGFQRRTDDPTTWRLATVQGNSGEQLVPWAAPGGPTIQDPDRVPRSFTFASGSAFSDTDMASVTKTTEEKKGVPRHQAVQTWADLQGLASFGRATLRVRVVEASGAERIVKAASGDPTVFARYDLPGLRAGDVALVSLVGSSGRVRQIKAIGRVPMGGTLRLVASPHLGAPAPAIARAASNDQPARWDDPTKPPKKGEPALIPVARGDDELVCVRVTLNDKALQGKLVASALHLQFLGELTYRLSAFLRFPT